MSAHELADFVANLDRINAVAESSPGFVWRLQTEAGDATALRPLGDDVLINRCRPAERAAHVRR